MKNFAFAMKWHEILKPYSDDIRREVYDAVIEYVASGQIIEMQPLARMAFDFIRYEIDDKARRREARLAKKQQKAEHRSGADEHISSAETLAGTPHIASGEPILNPDKIADDFMASGKAPEPFTVNKGSARITMTKKRIHSFVKRCAQDILGKKSSLPYTGIMSALDSLVMSRYERIRQDVIEQCPSKTFTEDLWDAIINYACDSIRA